MSSAKMKGNFWEIKAAATAADVLIYGDIGESWDGESISAKGFVEALGSVDPQLPITVHINSYGGSVSDGIAIYNAIQRHPGGATCSIEGVAVSIASLIAMAGQKVTMAENAMLMVHAPWAGTVGNSADMRDTADMLDKMALAMSSAYTKKTGQSQDAIMALLTDGKDHWMTAAEAQAGGFIDEITGALAAAAQFDLTRFERPAAGRNPINLPGETVMTPEKQTIETKTEAPDVSAQIAAAVAESQAAEAARRREIRNRLEPNAKDCPEINALMHAALDDPTRTVDQVSAEALKLTAKNLGPISGGRGPHIESGQSESEKFYAGVSNAIEAKAGLARHDPQNEFRSYSLIELARASLERAGEKTGSLSKLALAELALPSGMRLRPQASTLGESSSDFANLLANIATKTMLKGYSEAPETFQRWTVAGTLPDFKSAKRVDLNAMPSLSAINEGGEYSLAVTSDRGETVQLATYGKKFSITRQAIINDDLGAFTRIPQRMGQAAIRTIGNLVYAVLTANAAMSDGVALFHANHSNLLSSAGITTTSTAAARAAMKKQKDAASNVAALNIPLKYLIVPVALESDALIVANSQNEVGASARNNTTDNFMRGAFEVIADARLDATSTSQWYTCADPAMFDTVEVSYLDGSDQPYLEQQLGWDIDGVEFKVRIDAGVKALDWRTMTRTG